MSGADLGPAQGAGNNASEFVRKLFKMLEDPSHQDVARWGKDGDTFVVVEGEKFTRSILPKHFKHSNMSSFIRQLNKYDFHKVKPSSDAESSCPGGNILEFKHPYFRVDSKDDLDNIRRKAPAPRKTQPTEDFTTSQHVSVISEQLTATQQQVQQLQELFAEVSQTNRLLVNEVLTMQKMLNAQKQAQHEMLNFLSVYNGAPNANAMMAQRRMPTNGAGDGSESVPELQRARELLSSVAPDAIADRELERLHGVYGPLTDSAAMVTPVTMPLLHDPITDIARYPVYPVGQTVGIDPFHSDHINKIPYAIPGDGSGLTETQAAAVSQAGLPAPLPGATAPAAPPRDKSTALWGAKKPLVFLVEDDPTCAKIGIKFLKSMGCEVEHAENGADAYTRVTSVGRDHFDLIFMDIIMPKLDGVSATMYIRQHSPSTPVVAMTSNIRPDEVNGYFEHGMNGVLAKPFTKEGMLKSIKTHLVHLLKNPPPQPDQAFMIGNMPYLNPGQALSAGGTPIKIEGSVTPSGNGGSTWSPSNMGPGDVDGQYGMVNGRHPYGMAPSGPPPFQGQMDPNSTDSPPGKRQRLNPGGGNF